MASACLIVTLIFTFTSCSHLESLSFEKKISLDEGLAALCLNSEGAGRISYGGKKQVFQFESAHNRGEGSFELALNFAFHGEEYINLTHINSSGGARARGAMLEKIKQAWRKSKRAKDYRRLELFLKQWGNLISLAKLPSDHRDEVCKIKEGASECRYRGVDYRFFINLNREINISWLIEPEVYAKVQGKKYNLEKGYFERLNLIFKAEGRFGTTSDSFSLTLLLESCD